MWTPAAGCASHAATEIASGVLLGGAGGLNPLTPNRHKRRTIEAVGYPPIPLANSGANEQSDQHWDDLMMLDTVMAMLIVRVGLRREAVHS